MKIHDNVDETVVYDDSDCDVIPLHYAEYVELFNSIFGNKKEYDNNVFIKFSSEDIREIEEQYNCKVCINVVMTKEQAHQAHKDKKSYYTLHAYSLKFSTPEDKMFFCLKFM